MVMKKIISLVGCLAGAVAITGLAVLTGGSAQGATATEDTITKTFAVAPEGKLKLDADRGGIRVVTADQTKVEVVVKREVTRASADQAAEILREHQVTFTQDGNEIHIRAQGFKSGVGSWLRRQPNLNVQYQITLPRQFDASLKTAGGGIQVSDLQGQVEARTGGGGLTFSHIQGAVDGHTSGGGIQASGCTGPLKIETSGGGIDIKEFSGPFVRANTSGGGITADLASPPKSDCSLHTSGGGIRVRLPENAAVNLDAHTSGGGVSSDLPVTSQGQHGRGTLRGPINGGGPVLSLDTAGGGIHVQKR